MAWIYNWFVRVDPPTYCYQTLPWLRGAMDEQVGPSRVAERQIGVDEFVALA